MIVTDADTRSISARNTLDSPHIRANSLSLSHCGRSCGAEVMGRPMNHSSTRTESMASTGVAAMMAENATTSNQTNGSTDGQLVAALVTDCPADRSATEAVLLRAEAIPHFSRSQSEALIDIEERSSLSRDAGAGTES